MEEAFHGEPARAIASLLDRTRWEGEQWLRGLAGDAERIGAALGSPRHDAVEELSEHKRIVDAGYSLHGKLHSVLMCQASASALAEWIEEGDLAKPSPSQGAKTRVRRELIVAAMDRCYGVVNDVEKPAWAEALAKALAKKLGGGMGQTDIVSGMLRLASMAPSFTDDARAQLIAGATGSVPALSQRGESMGEARAPYVPVDPSRATPGVLLDFGHEPNDAVAGMMTFAADLFAGDPSTRLERRFYALCPTYAFDHPALRERYPHGLHDGRAMILPAAEIAGGFGAKKSDEHAKRVLSRAAREALGVETPSGEGPERVGSGSLHEILLGHGLPRPAGLLYGTEGERRRADAGFAPADVEAALREAVLEGLGLPIVHAHAAPADRLPEELLLEAVWLGQRDRVHALLGAGVKSDCRSSLGIAPLMLASSVGNMPWVQSFGSESALACVDSFGKAARDYAREGAKPLPANTEVVEWIERRESALAERAELLGLADEAREPKAAGLPRSTARRRI